MVVAGRLFVCRAVGLRLLSRSSHHSWQMVGTVCRIMFVRVTVHSMQFLDLRLDHSDVLADWPFAKFILGLPHPEISAVRTAVDALLVVYVRPENEWLSVIDVYARVPSCLIALMGGPSLLVVCGVGTL